MILSGTIKPLDVDEISTLIETQIKLCRHLSKEACTFSGDDSYVFGLWTPSSDN